MARVRSKAWAVLGVVGTIVALFGLSDLVGGGRDLGGGESALMHGLTGVGWAELQAAHPGAAHLVDWKFRSDGATLLAFGLLIVGLSVFGPRRGERWAWLLLWTVPAWMGATAVSVLASVEHPGFGTPVPVVSGSILGLASAIALVAATPGRQRAGDASGPRATRAAEAG